MDLITELNNRRFARVDKEGSPYFDIYPDAIAAGIIQGFDFELNDTLKPALKYLPLDFIQVINNDSVAIELRLHSTQKHYIPSGTIYTVTDENYHSFSIKNLDASSSTTAGKIQVICQRLALTEDKLVRRQHG